MKYYVSLEGRQYLVEVDGDSVVVDGQPVQATLGTVPGTPVRLLTMDQRTVPLAVLPDGKGQWVLLRRGEAVAIEVLDERSHHIRAMVGEGKAQIGGAVVKAPMPGLVVKVLVESGATVTAGTGLVILEAMKMENELKAPVSGTVVRVSAAAGQSVEKGESLVTIE